MSDINDEFRDQLVAALERCIATAKSGDLNGAFIVLTSPSGVVVPVMAASGALAIQALVGCVAVANLSLVEMGSEALQDAMEEADARSEAEAARASTNN